MVFSCTASLLDFLSRAGLLASPAMHEAACLAPEAATTPQEMLECMVEDGWLTAYQRDLILEGRGQELHLGPYVILDLLGEGGMGRVFKARGADGAIVALKLIRKERLANPETVRRFHREVRAALHLNHPNIVQALAAEEVAGQHVMVMEYIAGIDLAKWVKAHGPMPLVLACDCIRQTALGLQHAFECGLVHRDIKPHNLILSRQSELAEEGAPGVPLEIDVLKLLDLGLARMLEATEEESSLSEDCALTKDGVVVGTPDFLAPEQALDAHSADIRSDLYSLGCTFYYLLTGRAPFRSRSLTEVLLKHQTAPIPAIELLRPEVPPAIRAILNKLMAKRPERRFQTPTDLAQALDSSLLQSSSDMSIPIDVDPLDPSDDAEASHGTMMDSLEKNLEVAAALGSDYSLEGSLTLAAGDAHIEQVVASKRQWPMLGVAGLMLSLFVLGLVLWPRLVRARQKAAPSKDSVVEVLHPAPLLPAAQPVAPAPILPKAPPVVPIPPDPAPAPVKVVKPEAPPPRHELLDGAKFVQLNPSTPIYVMTMSHDGRTVLLGSSRMMSLDSNTGKIAHLFRGKESHFVSSVVFTGNDRYAVTGGDDNRVHIWHIASGYEQKVFSGHAGPVRCVALSRDGSLLLSGGGPHAVNHPGGKQIDLTVRLLLRETFSGNFLRGFDGHQREVTQAAFTPDARFVLSSDSETIRYWDAESGKELRKFSGATQDTNGLVFTPDGRHALIGSGDSKVRLWEVATGKPIRLFAGHEGAVCGVAVSADGRLALSGGKDKTVRLWDITTGQQLQCFKGHRGRSSQRAFHGRWLPCALSRHGRDDSPMGYFC